MKVIKNDVILLLAFILFFCFGLGFLRNDNKEIFFSAISPNSFSDFEDEELQDRYSRNENVRVSVPERFQNRKRQSLADLSTDELLSYMKPLFMTKSATAIISFLKHIPAATVFKIVQAIVHDSKIHLPNRVKLRVIFAGAQRQKSWREKCAYFDLIAQDKRLQKGVKPLLVKAVEAGYSHLVYDILAWAKTADVGDISQEALLYATRHDDEDPEALRELFEAGVPIKRTVAATLLFELIEHCNEGYSIPFLVQDVGVNANYIISGETPLMGAVRENKIGIAFELIKCGADPKFRVPGSQYISAVHLAQKNGNKEMEEFLYSHRVISPST